MQKSVKKVLIIDIAVLIVVAIILAVSMKWAYDIELKLGLLYYADKSEVEESDIVEPRNLGVRVSADGAENGAAEGKSLNVHFVDVGQGDCTIIEFPDGKTMIIDGGENNKKTEAAIKTFVDNTFTSNFKYFDYAILTHPDSDHCGSFDYALNSYPARFVYRPNVEAVGTKSNPYVDPGKSALKPNAITKSTAAYAASIKAMYQKTDDFTSVVYITDPSDDSQTIKGCEGEDDEYSFTFYSPLSDNYGTKETNASWNDYSPIMILEYRGFKFAMSGDAEEENLGEFVQKVQKAKTDGVTDKYDVFTDSYCVNVIKAGHHGSRNATTSDYLEVLTTDIGASGVYCVVSCGKGNGYGHPHKEAMERYKAAGVKDENILRTDIVGDISFSVHIDEEGNYNLYYGSVVTRVPVQVLVYRKLGSVKLKWALVAWVGYAVLVVVAAAHIVITSMHSGGQNGQSGQNKDKRNNRRQQ
ncbi:MAG: hypothetical protein J1G01_02890 [Clostridiales bacterium]|nr:hypothetical protein [Clostridiales bacterium]